MRQVERIAGGARAVAARRGRRFEDALRGAVDARSAELRSRAAAGTGVPSPAQRRVAPAVSPPGQGERRHPPPELACVGSPPPLASQGELAAVPGAPPELRALARALPVAVETFGVPHGAPLALSFGRALDIELRSVPGGVELLLRADSRLARACAAGMPGLVAALERRGIAVVRAEVRGRRAGLGGSGGVGPGRPFVDLPVPLR
jgi:hypothetical protein